MGVFHAICLDSIPRKPSLGYNGSEMHAVLSARHIEVIALFESFTQLSPVLQALIGTGFTWFVTALGARIKSSHVWWVGAKYSAV